MARWARTGFVVASVAVTLFWGGWLRPLLMYSGVGVVYYPPPLIPPPPDLLLK